MDMKRNDKRIIKELKMIGLHHFELLSLEEEQALGFGDETFFDYLVDCLPYRIKIANEHYHEETRKYPIPRTSFNDLEDFLYRIDNFSVLVRKWYTILMKLAYYFKLDSVYLYCGGVMDNKELLKVAGEDGVILRYRPMEVMSRLEEFVESMNEEFRHTDFTFDFENGMRITLDKEDFFMGVNFRKPGKVETKDMELIQKLIESEGLFFHETGYVEK